MYPEKSIRLNAFQANIPFLYLPKTIKPDIFYFLEDIEREHWPEIGQLSKGFTAKQEGNLQSFIRKRILFG